MLLEEQRFLHEDLERLEQGISDRVADDPRHVGATEGWRAGGFIENADQSVDSR